MLVAPSQEQMAARIVITVLIIAFTNTQEALFNKRQHRSMVADRVRDVARLREC